MCASLPEEVVNKVVSDLALGAVATLYTWAIYPAAERALGRIRPQALDRIAVIVVTGFVALCAVKFLPV